MKIWREKFRLRFDWCFESLMDVGFMKIVKKKVGIVDWFVKSVGCRG